MAKLKLEDRMTIQTLARRHVPQCEIARLLGVSEGAVRYQVKRMAAGAVDGRSRQEMCAAKVAAAIEHWREQHVAGVELGGVA